MNPDIEFEAPQEEMPKATWRDTGESIGGMIDGLEAVEQHISTVLGTQRYAYTGYTDDFGIDLSQYIGEDFDLLEATIETELEEALVDNDFVYAIADVELEQIRKNAAVLKFTALTPYGEQTEEREVAI